MPLSTSTVQIGGFRWKRETIKSFLFCFFGTVHDFGIGSTVMTTDKNIQYKWKSGEGEERKVVGGWRKIEEAKQDVRKRKRKRGPVQPRRFQLLFVVSDGGANSIAALSLARDSQK